MHLLVAFLLVLIDVRKFCMKYKYVAGKFVNRKLFKIPIIKTLHATALCFEKLIFRIVFLI
jgi:hypothetical protein